MSLDLSNPAGRAFTPAAVTDLSTLAEASFSGDLDNAGKIMVLVDTSAGDIDAGTLITSLTLASGAEVFADGFEATLIKSTTDGNRITFTDPQTTFVYNYVNRQTESLTLVYDLSTGTGRWLAKA
jgi:hypothetical protein